MPRTDDNQATLSAVAPVELVDALKALAQRHGRTVSGELRIAVMMWVEFHEDNYPVAQTQTEYPFSKHNLGINIG